MLGNQWLISPLLTMILVSLGTLLFHEILIRRVDQLIAKYHRHLIIFEEPRPWVSTAFWLALAMFVQSGERQTAQQWFVLNLLLLIFLYALFMLELRMSISLYLLSWAYYWFLTDHQLFSTISAPLFTGIWILLAVVIARLKRHRVNPLIYPFLLVLIGSFFWTWVALSQYKIEPRELSIQFCEFMLILAVNYYTIHLINKERLKQRAILHQAMYDRLTNLYNFHLFDQNFHRAYQEYCRHQRPLTMIAIDIDHFKQINDTHGHLFGNQTLQQVARILKTTTSKLKDVTVYRTGGEEFNILVTNKSLTFTAELANQIATAMSEVNHQTTAGQVVALTLSIGVSKLNDSDSSAQDYFHRTDKLLYTAKRAGGNRIELERL